MTQWGEVVKFTMPSVVSRMQEQKSKLVLVVDAKIEAKDAKSLAGLHATFLLYLLSLPESNLLNPIRPPSDNSQQ